MSETKMERSPVGMRRPKRLNVRFSEAEYGHLLEVARTVNLKPAGLVRNLVAGIPLKVVPRFPDNVQRAMKSLGGNLNQLSHQANMGRVDKREVEALRADVSRLLQAVLR